MNDSDYMALAAKIALKGEGMVEPNPCVGAIIVKDGKIVGRGFHRKFGGLHAEIYALKDAGGKSKGASMYVTLEPCCHFGKTPPCTKALIKAGIGEVFVACTDPNPLVSGKGILELKKHGIRVRTLPLEQNPACAFLHFHTTGLPYVIAKWAMTADGKIATETGDSKWITSEEARRFARKLRFKSQAVIVGATTVRKDDPHLLPEPPKRNFLRVVVTATGNIPENAFVVKTARKFPTLVVASGYADPAKLNRLEKRGCIVRTTETITAKSVLDILAGMNIIKVSVEGGGRMLAAFFDENLVNEAYVFIAPKVIGSSAAVSPVSGIGKKLISETNSFTLSDFFKIGSDVCMVMKRVKRASS